MKTPQRSARLAELPSHAGAKRSLETRMLVERETKRREEQSARDAAIEKQDPFTKRPLMLGKNCADCHPDPEPLRFDPTSLMPPPVAAPGQIRAEIDRRFDAAVNRMTPQGRAGLADEYSRRLAAEGKEARAMADRFRLDEAARLRTAAGAANIAPDARAKMLAQAGDLVRRPLGEEAKKQLAQLEATPNDQIGHRDAKAALALVRDHSPADLDRYDRRTGLAPGHGDIFVTAEEESRRYGNPFLDPTVKQKVTLGKNCADCHPEDEPLSLNLNLKGYDFERLMKRDAGRPLLDRALPPAPPPQPPRPTADPRTRLKIPEAELTPEQRKIYEDHVAAYRLRSLEDRIGPHFARLDAEYEKNGWSDDSPWFGVDREAFLADVNAKDPKTVSRYDGFRALREADAFRRANPEVFKGAAGDFATSRRGPSDLYFTDVEAMRRAGLAKDDLDKRLAAIREDPNNPIPYLQKPMGELDARGLDTVTRDYTRFGVERLERRMRDQVVGGIGQEVDRLDRHFDRLLRDQGVIGDTANWIKNNWGAKDGWVVDSERGSNAVVRSIGEAYAAKRRFAELSGFQGTHAEFEKEYQARLGELNAKIRGVGGHIRKFNDSQNSWVEGITDFASVGAAIAGAALAPVTGGASLAVGAGIGAMTKVGLKTVDGLTGTGTYNGDVLIDALKGGLNGGSGVGTNLLARAAAGKLMANATARLAAGESVPMLARAGIWGGTRIGEGAVDGYVTQFGGSLIDGKPIDEANANGLRGAAFGAVLNPLAQGATDGVAHLWRAGRASKPTVELDWRGQPKATRATQPEPDPFAEVPPAGPRGAADPLPPVASAVPPIRPTPGMLDEAAVDAANQAVARGALGKEAPLDEALIQRLPGYEQRATNAAYGRAMADATRELEGKIASGEIKTFDEALAFMSKKTREVAAAVDRRGDLAGNQTFDDFGKMRTDGAITPMNGRYGAYRDPAADAVDADPGAMMGVLRRATDDGIDLTTQWKSLGRWGAVWEHTHPSQFPKIAEKMEGAWKKALDAKSPRELVDAVAELHWWGAHMMPFNRGSAGAIDGMTKALLLRGGIKPGNWREGVGIDLEAFQLSRQEFIRRYASFFAQ